jgi:hypothetical protein
MRGLLILSLCLISALSEATPETFSEQKDFIAVLKIKESEVKSLAHTIEGDRRKAVARGSEKSTADDAARTALANAFRAFHAFVMAFEARDASTLRALETNLIFNLDLASAQRMLGSLESDILKSWPHEKTCTEFSAYWSSPAQYNGAPRALPVIERVMDLTGCAQFKSTGRSRDSESGKNRSKR